MLYFSIFIPLLIFLITVIIIAITIFVIGSDTFQSVSQHLNSLIVSLYFVSFLYFIIQYLNRLECYTIKNKHNKENYSFLKENGELQRLIKEIQFRKSIIDNVNPYPLNYFISESKENRWISTLPYMFLLVIFLNWIGIILILLMILCLPIQSLFYLLKYPYKYRKALNCFENYNYNKALKLIKELIRQKPNYIPAKLLQIQLLMRIDFYYEANNVLKEIFFEIDLNEFEALQYDIWMRERIWRRKILIKPLRLQAIIKKSLPIDRMNLKDISFN